MFWGIPTGSSLLPDLRKLCAILRLGTEGETGRSEGGESYSFDNAPRQIYDVLNRFRLARVGGRTYETKTKQT